MIENIEVTTGVAIVVLAWICGTTYSIIRKNPEGIQCAFWITVGYALFKIHLLKQMGQI